MTDIARLFGAGCFVSRHTRKRPWIGLTLAELPAHMRSLLLFSVFFLLLLLTSTASAAISLHGDTTRTDPKGINLRDCVEDQRVHFFLSLTDFAPEGVVEAWVSKKSVDCKSAAARANESECVKVGEPAAPNNELDLTLPIRSIVAPITSKTAAATPSVISECTTTLDGADIEAHFLYFAKKGDDAAPLFATSTVLGVDLVLPPRPSSTPSVKPGEPWASLNVSWSSAEENTRTNIYCTKLTAQNSVDSKVATCSPIGFKVVDSKNGKEAPVVPTAGFDASFLCATSSVESPDQITLLTSADRAFEQGGVYAFAIAHVDAFGNVGELSPTTCYEPEKFQQEQCSFVRRAPAAPASSSSTTLIMLLASAVLAIRARLGKDAHHRPNDDRSLDLER